MMSTDELYDQINADEKVILDSIGTDEKGWPTPPMAPLEVLVRYTVFGEVYGLIDDDYFNTFEFKADASQLREYLSVSFYCEKSFDKSKNRESIKAVYIGGE